MESAKGRVCCRSARVTALPVTVFLRSGRIGWFIGKSDFFVPIATVYRLLLCRLLPFFIGFVAFPWGVDRFAAADGYTVSANVY